MTQEPPSHTHLSPGGSTQRQHIIDTALSLMAQNGVDGTSMRDLASAASLNVASLYHYFPSKRELLIAVLEQRGMVTNLGASQPRTVIQGDSDVLVGLLDQILQSMLEVEDFVRLMLGEVMRGQETAHTLGVELLTATQVALERWLTDIEPELCARVGAPAVARLLRAMVVGVFVEHVAGVIEEPDGTSAAFRERAEEVAAILRSRV